MSDHRIPVGVAALAHVWRARSQLNQGDEAFIVEGMIPWAPHRHMEDRPGNKECSILIVMSACFEVKHLGSACSVLLD
jgi:hypothetical protein